MRTHTLCCCARVAFVATTRMGVYIGMAASNSCLQEGFDCSFVHPSELQSECSICLHVLREPYLVTCCGNRFCRACIEPIQRVFKKCPLCALNFSSLPDKELESMLKEQLVYCTHKNEGCVWTGKLATLESHININGNADTLTSASAYYSQGCLYTMVNCYHCKKPFHRFTVKDHADICDFRQVSCKYCKTFRDRVQRMETVHYPVCPEIPVPCPSGCDARLLRKDLSQHVKDSCPMTVVPCPFKCIGCGVKLPRKDLPGHAKAEKHFSIAVTRIEEVRKENSELKQENLRLKEEIMQKCSDKGPLSSVKHLLVTNIPQGANKHMVKSVFGQHGFVEEVKMHRHHAAAEVTYEDSASAQAALNYSVVKGINLRYSQLKVSPVYLTDDFKAVK